MHMTTYTCYAETRVEGDVAATYFRPRVMPTKFVTLNSLC